MTSWRHCGSTSARGEAWSVIPWALLLWLAIGIGPLHAYVYEVTDSGLPLYWAPLRLNPPAPLQYTYCNAGSSRLGGTLPNNSPLRSALDFALMRWASIPTATVRMQPSIVSPNRTIQTDGVNNVVFTSVNNVNFTGSDGPYIVGLTTTSYDPDSGAMVDADIQFNDTSSVFALSLSQQTGNNVAGSSAYYINLKDVATHEAGHSLGLDHSGMLGTTMYFAAQDGATEPGADDVAAISNLYPASGYASSTAIISGHVYKPAPVFGAEVMAVNIASGWPTVGAITRPDGSYQIAGLPPGSYVLVAQPLMPNALGWYYQNITTSFNLGVYAPAFNADPTVLTVAPGQQVANIDIRVDSRRLDINAAGSMANAQALAVPGAVSRHLVPGSSSRPADYFSFQAAAGSTVSLNVCSFRLWMPMDVQLAVLDSSGNLVAGPSTNLAATSPWNLDDQLLFTPTVQGNRTYYLRVTAGAADQSLFPDDRSIVQDDTFYLVTTRLMRQNHPPQILLSGAATTLTTEQAGPGRPNTITLDLSQAATDAEDLVSDLRWSVSSISNNLVSVDQAALSAQPPRLVLRPLMYRSGSGTITLTVYDSDQATASVTLNLNLTPVTEPPVATFNINRGGYTVGPRLLQLDGGSSSGAPPEANAQAGQPYTMNWVQTAGPPLSFLTGSTSPVLDFFARDAAHYAVQLTVTQSGVASPLTSTLNYDFTVANRPPLAKVVAPTVALVSQSVICQASLSGDANEDLKATAFVLSAVTPGGLSAEPTQLATGVFSFTAPAAPGRYVYQLAVTDSGTWEPSGPRSNPLTTQTNFAIEVRAAGDVPPTADAGPDRVVNAGDLVMLDGRESRSPSGDPFTCSWSVEPLTTGTASVTLSDSTTMTPTFTAPLSSAAYRFTLVTRCTRTGLESAPSSCHVQVVGISQNRFAPAAVAQVAGVSAGVVPGQTVLLDGTSSADPEGGRLSYHWVQVQGVPVSLTTSSGSTPSFEPPATGTYEFELQVSDGQLLSRRQPTSVVCGPATTPPAVLFSASQPFLTGAIQGPTGEVRYSVDGTDATSNTVQLSVQLDDSSQPRTYVWEQVVGPRVPYLLGADQASLRFIPQQARVFGFRVTAILPDGRLTRATRYVVVDVGAAHVPRAQLAGNTAVTALQGDPIQMNGSASQDFDAQGIPQDNPQMLYYWEQEDGPPVPLSQALTATPSFTPPLVGRYSFRLRVDNQRDGTMSAPVGPFQAMIIVTSVPTGNQVSIAGSGNTNGSIRSVSKGGCALCEPPDAAQDTGGILLLFLPFLVVFRLRPSRK